ncbi:MAG: hypothetical protein SCARUB_05042, partial [Candidatus Scalindua rubra]
LKVTNAVMEDLKFEVLWQRSQTQIPIIV